MRSQSILFAAFAVVVAQAANPESFNTKRADNNALASLTDPLAGVLGLVTGLLGGILTPLTSSLGPNVNLKVTRSVIPAAHDHTARAVAPDYNSAIAKLESTLEQVKKALKAKTVSKRDDATAAPLEKGQFGAGADPVSHCFGICDSILSALCGHGGGDNYSGSYQQPTVVVNGGGGGGYGYNGGNYGGSVTYGVPNPQGGFQASGSIGGGGGSVDIGNGGYSYTVNKRAAPVPDYSAAIAKLESTIATIKGIVAAKANVNVNI
ncbi:hypothetical protein RQP46_000909 [Phenoliferia psychrophenolica]